jgi:hypothetical protein
MGAFGRRLLWLRKKLAVAAVALSAPNTRWRECAVQVAIDPVETGYAGARDAARDPRLESQQVKPANREVLEMEETPPDCKPGFA